MKNPTGGMRIVLNRLEEGMMATLLALMTLLTFVQVVLRYVFNTGLVWSVEATTYSFAALVLIGMSYGVRTQTHIAVDLLTNKLPKPIRRHVALLSIVLCLVYAGLMLYGASVFVERLAALGNMARDIPAPKWLLTLVMPVGFALLAFRFLEAGWSVIKGEDYYVESHEHGEHDASTASLDEQHEQEGDGS